MKSIILVCIVATMAFAEPPPSNSYLPPSAAGRSGYPQGAPSGPAFSDVGPQVIAARSFPGQGQGHGQGHGHGHAPQGNHAGHGNGFARSGSHDHGAQARFGGQGEHQGYDHNAGAFGRNAADELSGEPANYNFGYMVNDYQEGTDFGHHEEREEERAHGEYHVVLPDGRKQTVSYEADEQGFKPRISYQDTEDLSRSGAGGYDSNANNVRSHGNHGNGFNHGGHGNHGNARSNGY